MNDSSSDTGCLAFVIIILMFLVTCDRIGDNQADIARLQWQFEVHHIDSDDWAESAASLGINSDSMTMKQFKDHDSIHTEDAIYAH